MGKEVSDILSVAQAAKEAKMSPRQLRNYIASGVLPAEKIGRDYLIRRVDLGKVPKPKDRKPGPKPKEDSDG